MINEKLSSQLLLRAFLIFDQEKITQMCYNNPQNEGYLGKFGNGVMAVNDFNELNGLLSEFEKQDKKITHAILEQVTNEYCHLLSDDIIKRLDKQRITHPELVILTKLSIAKEQTLAYSQLVADSLFSQGLISRYVKRLAQLSLVEKFHRVGNRKALFLTATPEGITVAKIHTEVQARRYEYYNERLAKFNHDQYVTALAVLKSLAEK